MLRINNIKLSLDGDFDALKKKAASLLGIKCEDFSVFKIARKSLDARDKQNIYFVYAVDVESKKKFKETTLLKNKNISHIEPFNYFIPKLKPVNPPPVIVGSGPAGLFAGLTLAQAGLNPIILEQGKPVDERQKDVTSFWRTGILNPYSNVQFGEGGAGTFSDGKLTTGIKDPLCRKVLEEFVQAGAPEEILYLAKPHIGTDKLVQVVKNLRRKIISYGGQVLFAHKLKDIIHDKQKLTSITIEGQDKTLNQLAVKQLILAIGHSSREVFSMLHDRGFFLQPKPFAVGVRIEHPQFLINRSQYGASAGHPELGAADYKLACHLKTGNSAFTFCMCPGGQVVAAASEPGYLVTNGMSEYSRSFPNANSALLIGVAPSHFGSSQVLAGMYFQRRLEEAAFILGGSNYSAPAQLVGDFLKGIPTKSFKTVTPSYLPGVVPCDLAGCLPDFIIESLRQAIGEMDKKIQGFALYDAVLTGVETRSSSPVRIVRGQSLESNITGVYPCGEGAGYAGGIMSAATDGIRCAEKIIEGYSV